MISSASLSMLILVFEWAGVSLNALLFFGGWLPPVDWEPLYAVPGIVWLLLKAFFFFFMFSWVMATVPRYRYDQLMRLGWKVFLPISLAFVVLISGWLMATGITSRIFNQNPSR